MSYSFFSCAPIIYDLVQVLTLNAYLKGKEQEGKGVVEKWATVQTSAP